MMQQSESDGTAITVVFHEQERPPMSPSTVVTAKPIEPPPTEASMMALTNSGTQAQTAKSIPVTAYNSPKEALLGCVKAGLAKSILAWWEMALLGFNAGFFLAFGSIAALVIAAGFAAPTLVTDVATKVVTTSIAGNPALAKLIYGLIFPVGLVIIVLAGSELFTGNVMYLTLAYLSGKAEGKNVAKNLTIVWLANLAGSTFCAFFLAYLPQLLHFDPQLSYLVSAAEKKIALGMERVANHPEHHTMLPQPPFSSCLVFHVFSLTSCPGWGSAFLRGVGCNWLVCIGLWQNLCSHDVISKFVAIWLPIATFIWIGWEHSVANMLVVPLALMEGVPGRHFGHFLAYNLIPVTLGNMVGGATFAIGQLLIYGQYAKYKVATMTTKHAEKRV